MQLHTFSVCVDLSTWANNGHFLATWVLWSHHENASVEKIICPVEQTKISFPHDIIRRSITDVVLSFVGIPRHVFQYNDSLTVWKVCKLAFVTDPEGPEMGHNTCLVIQRVSGCF